MNLYRHVVAKMLSLLCAFWLSSSLCAAPPQPMNPDQLVQHVQSRYGGRVLDMQPVKTSQGDSYRVKLLQPSGKVKMLLIDSSSGDARSFGQGGSDKKGP